MPTCVCCGKVGNDTIANLPNLSEIPPQLNRKRNAARNQVPNNPAVNNNAAANNNANLSFPQDQKAERPKHVFSANNWTQDKEVALETLLKQ